MYFSPKAGTLSKEKQVPGSAQAPPGMRTPPTPGLHQAASLLSAYPNIAKFFVSN